MLKNRLDANKPERKIRFMRKTPSMRGNGLRVPSFAD